MIRRQPMPAIRLIVECVVDLASIAMFIAAVIVIAGLTVGII